MRELKIQREKQDIEELLRRQQQDEEQRREEKILKHHLWGHRCGGEVLVLVRECDERDGERHSEAHDDGGENMDEGEPGR